MILDLVTIRGYSLQEPQQDSWEQEFIDRLNLQKQTNFQAQQPPAQSYSISPILDFINRPPLSNQTFQCLIPSSPHSYYSTFVPLRAHSYKGYNELQKEIPYLETLAEQGLDYSQENMEQFILQNQEALLSARKQSVLKTINPCLPMVERTRKWAQLLNEGTSMFRGQKRNIGAWSHSLSKANCYLSGMRNQAKLRDNLELTVEANENISSEVISRTMKNLFCPVCLIYDCFTHDAIGGNRQYVSPNNKITQETHLSKSVSLISKSINPNLQGEETQSCSPRCYLMYLRGQNVWKGQYSCLSVLAKSIIQLGIHLFSFEPCLIAKLFRPQEVGCIQIFQFLTTQCSMFSRIDCKFYYSEYLMLANEQRELVPAYQMPVCDARRRRKKKQVKSARDKVGGKPICTHHFASEPSQDLDCKNCNCRKRGFCLPECLCSSSCVLMKVGCKCKTLGGCRTNQCPCFRSKTECHPGLCRGCCSEEKLGCRNLGIQRSVRKHIRIGISKIKGAGLGAYAGEFICKDELVTVYLGQAVEPCIEELRHAITRDSSFYNFDTNGLTLDARFIGNKARFINHGDRGSENLGVQIMQSQGQEWICFFALRDIQEHEELYFDYDGTGELAKHHHQKYPFIAPKKG